MRHIDGTAARQLELLDDFDAFVPPAPVPQDSPAPQRMRLLRKDIYAELARRRRRAQIAARHLLDRAGA